MARGKMATRHGERELAFQVLYGLSFGSVQTLEELQDIFYNSPGYPAKESTSTAPSGFAWELVEGVWKSATLLDDVIDRHSHNWRVNRMGRVELTLLRLAVFEMLCRDDIPAKVAINEALDLSRQFGEDGAGSFINGILDAVAKAQENGTLKSPLVHNSSPSQQAG